MAGSRSPKGRSDRLRAVLSSLLWVGLGMGLGVGIGVVWSVPGLVRDWWTGPMVTLAIAGGGEPSAPVPPSLEPPPLEQFRRLQEGSVPPRAGGSQSARARPAPHRAPPKAPPSSRLGAEAQTGAAARVIAEIARTRAVPPSAGTPVVQVASEPTRARADALVDRLVREDFRAYVSGSRPEGSPRYRVRVRTARGQTPRVLAKALEARGFAVWVTNE